MVSYRPWGAAWNRAFASILTGSTALPHLSLTLLASGPASGVFLLLQPPSFSYLGTAAPGNSYTGVGCDGSRVRSVHRFSLCDPSKGLFSLYKSHDAQSKVSVTSLNTRTLRTVRTQTLKIMMPLLAVASLLLDIFS